MKSIQRMFPRVPVSALVLSGLISFMTVKAAWHEYLPNTWPEYCAGRFCYSYDVTGDPGKVRTYMNSGSWATVNYTGCTTTIGGSYSCNSGSSYTYVFGLDVWADSSTHQYAFSSVEVGGEGYAAASMFWAAP